MNRFFRDILQERDADNEYHYSWARVQSFISFFYFLGLYTKQTWVTHEIPDVPEGWIFLIGVSSATYLLAKYSNRYPGMGMGMGFGYGAPPIVYNGPPHTNPQTPPTSSTIVPGPNGPSPLSVMKDDSTP